MTRFDEVDANKFNHVIRKNVNVSSTSGASPLEVTWNPAECCELTFDAIANYTFVVLIDPAYVPVHGETLRINYVARTAPTDKSNVIFDFGNFLGASSTQRWINAKYANGYMRYVVHASGEEWRWYPDEARSESSDAYAVRSSLEPVGLIEYSGSDEDALEGPTLFLEDYFGRLLVAATNSTDAVTYSLAASCASAATRNVGAADGLNMRRINNFMSGGSGVVWVAGSPSTTAENLVAVSSNGGLSWAAVTNLPIADSAWMVSVEDANTASVLLYISASSVWRIYRTTNGGTSWTLNGTLSGIHQNPTAVACGGTGSVTTEALICAAEGWVHLVTPTDTGTPVHTGLYSGAGPLRCIAYMYNASGDSVGAMAAGDEGQVLFASDYTNPSGWEDVTGGLAATYHFRSLAVNGDFFHALVADDDKVIYYTASRSQGRQWTRPSRIPNFVAGPAVARTSLSLGTGVMYLNLNATMSDASHKAFVYRMLRPYHLSV